MAPLTRFALLLPTLALLAAAAGADALKARSADGDLVLVQAGDAGYVTRPDGLRVALPAGANVHSFAAAGERWYAAAVARGRLVVVQGAGEKAKELPAPAVRHAAVLGEPTLLVDDGGLRGLAWIEGEAPRRQSVRAAEWSAGGWRPPVTVAPPGAGSQMALAAARLDDGAWLLAWAAFDGEDDEILWSRWHDGRASAPVRLAADNPVPDITPRLHAVPGGALAAWSRYDGNDYRLQLARFDGTSWTEPETVGPAGSVYPTFEPGPDGPVVLYLRAVPRAWVVAELDGHGAIRRQAEARTLAAERPLVSVTREAVTFEWLGAGGVEEATSAELRDVR